MVFVSSWLMDEWLKVQSSFVTFPAKTDNIMLPKNSCPEDMEAARHDPSVVSILEQVGMMDDIIYQCPPKVFVCWTNLTAPPRLS